jgi:hypothetical protein
VLTTHEQRKGRARADGEFIVFVKDKSREQNLYKASLIKGRNADKALKKSAKDVAKAEPLVKSVINAINIPTSRSLVTGIGYNASVQSMLSPASTMSNDPQGIYLRADNSAAVSPSTPFNVPITEERDKCSYGKTARSLEVLFKDLSKLSSDCSSEKYNKLMPAVSTKLDSETGTFILSCDESQTNGTIGSILVPKTSDAISDSFVSATKKESQGSDSDSVCSSKAVPKKVKELNIPQEHARRTITIKLQIDESLYRFRVSITKMRTYLFLNFILPTQSHLSSSRIQL